MREYVYGVTERARDFALEPIVFVISEASLCGP